MKLEHQIAEGGALIRHKPRMLGKSLPYDQWLQNAEKQQVFALSQLQSLLEDHPEAARPENGGVFLASDAIARLEESTAIALGLPPSTRLALRLRSQDQIMSPDFRVQKRWVKGGGVPVRVKAEGAFLHYGGKIFRLPEPIYSLSRTANTLSDELPEDQRLKAYTALGDALRADLGTDVADIDDYLNGVTIYHAAAFSLQLGINKDEFDFDPVLFSQDTGEAAEEGAAIDEEDDSLLPPAYQELFAKKWFRHYGEARTAYPLKDGSFVVLDPQLKRAMQGVRRIQSADSETRRSFISNPGKTLSELLGDEAAGAASLFIETEQFSERVTGIDIWRQPVLPWIKPTPNSWIPESFGVRIGDDYVTLKPESAVQIQKELEQASADGKSTIEIKGANGAKHVLPVTEQAISAINDIADIARAAQSINQDAGEAETGDELPEILREKRFLTVHENFEEVEFEALASSESGTPKQLDPPNFSGLVSTLKPHQREGVGWLWSALGNGFPGVLLADDMGLGKTLQVLAFILAARKVDRSPALIVAPTGLLANWRKEIALHFSENAFPYVVEAFGKNIKNLKKNGSPGHDITVGQDLLDSQKWADADIVFTTYETMRDYHFSFAKTKFGIIAFDEIQKLKNPASQMSRASRSLNGRMSIGMTGTPVENRLQDLWSIVDVLWPGKLGSSRSFEQRFPANNAEKLDQLRQALFDGEDTQPPLALRRMKADQLEGLPEKLEHAKEVEMPEFQAGEYQKSVVRARAMKDGASPGDSMLKILHELRMISLHPRRPQSNESDIAAYAAESARLKETFEILEKIKAKNEKALIFLESLEMQSFLASAIQKRFALAERPHRIHGGVKGLDRQVYVDQFQSRGPGFDVMILSPKAGGVGLTLTAANHVIHLSRWWNPAVEDQSTDRAFRIGQEKDVHVYYPMAVHPSPALRASSFDLRLNDLLNRKRSLSAHMLAPPEDRDGDAAMLFGGIVDASPLDESATKESLPDRKETDGAKQTLQADKSEPAIAGTMEHVKAAEAEPESPDVAEPVSEKPTPVSAYYQSFEGQAADLSMAFNAVGNNTIKLLTIEDPYLMANDTNRRCAAQFILEISKHFGLPKRVNLVFMPPFLIPGRDVDTPEEAHQKLKQLLVANYHRAGLAMPPLGWQTRRKTREQDFHDRYVRTQLQGFDGQRQLNFLLTGGIDRLMRPEFNVSVVLIPG
jgi:SNF2 domain-containing protein/helicase-like protein